MADMLHNNLPISSYFSRFSPLSLPLNLSPHSNFSFIRFAPLRRRFSHFSVLAKISSDSSQFDIISRIELADGSVSFKFGDASEISETVNDFDGGNEVELERESEDSLASEDDAVTDDETDSTKAENFDTNRVELKEIATENADSLVDLQSGAQICEGSVDDEQNCDSILTVEVENSSDFDVEKDENIVEMCDSSVGVITEKAGELSGASEELSDDHEHEHEHGGDELYNIGGTSLDVKTTGVVVSLEDETVKNEVVEDETVKNEVVEDELVKNGIVKDKIVEDETVKTEIVEDETVKNEIVEDEIVKEEIVGEEIAEDNVVSLENEIEEDGIVKDKIVKDEIVEDGIVEDENVEDETVKNEIVEDEIVEDEIVEDEIVENETEEDKVVPSEDEIVKDNIVKNDIVEDEIVKDENVEVEIVENEIVNDATEKDMTVSLEYEIEENLVVSSEDEIKKPSVLVTIHPISEDEDDESVELMSKKLEAEPILDEETSFDSLDDVVTLGSSLGSNKIADDAFPAFEQFDEGLCTSDILEATGPEASGINLVESIQDSVNMDVSTRTLSVSSAAASLLHTSEVTEAGHSSIASLDDDPHTSDGSDAAPGIEASGKLSTETSFDRVNSLNIEDVSSSAASSPSSSESDDDQHCSDSSKAAGSDPRSSGIALAEVSIESVQISTVANAMIPAAVSSPDSSEVHDATTHSNAQPDDITDSLVAVDPVTSGIASPEIDLDGVNEVETLSPAFSIISAAASLADSSEALTGGKDAHFVSGNWYGVADGVGQWSLEGVDMGLYAHEIMQNCEKLLKSLSAGSMNVKELLQQSAAMTQSTGSARVLIAHVANEVLHVANIGDSGFVIIRNGAVFQKSSPMVHEFSFPYAIGLGDDSVEDAEEYRIDLEDGDVIVTATDGLFDNLYEQEIASMVSKALEPGMSLQDLAELLATKAEEVGRSKSARSPFADAAQAAGHPGYSGGKLDHVTVIVSLVQRR